MEKLQRVFTVYKPSETQIKNILQYFSNKNYDCDTFIHNETSDTIAHVNFYVYGFIDENDIFITEHELGRIITNNLKVVVK